MWYWFFCPDCKWHGIRYRNVKKCHKCRSTCIMRGQQATTKEVMVETERMEREHKKIPD